MAKGKHSHRRGGTHRVKDEDRTWTHWDDKSYEELKHSAKERPGLYRKDMKKVEIAKALAADDKGLEIEHKKKKRENERKIAALKRRAAEKQQEQERLKSLVVEKQEGRARRKVAGHNGTSDTTDEEAREIVLDLEPLNNSYHNTKIAGELLSDEDEWDETSASEASMSASISPIYPDQKLRIFEWTYPMMPSCVPPQPKYPRSMNLDKNDITDEALPRKIPYVIMNLVTMISEEKVELPGRKYPESVGPGFVPRVSQHTIDCARNGVLISSLRKAIIERGVDWAKRTRLQGWNARMYFYLPPRSLSVSLSDVYAKWSKPAQAVDPRTGRIVKKRTKKQVDKKKDQRQKILEILAASEWRPPICYLPAYLEYTEPKERIEGANNVENLFYIRFLGMDLPHFYFWADDGWDNPTMPNPEWLEAKLEDEEEQRQEILRRKQIKEHKQTHQCDAYSIYNPFSNIDQARTRVKKSKPPRKFQSPERPPKGSKYKVALWNIERDIYQDGFALTLYKYRTHWLAEGKREDWELLSKNLPELYPSGKLPDAPPVYHHNVSSQSLAEKLAAIEVPSSDRTISPIHGDEPWTRDDDAYWSVVSIPSSPVSSPETLHRPKDLDLGKPSVVSSPVLRRPDSLRSGLSSFSPSYDPTREQVCVFEKEKWEELFLEHNEQAKKRQAHLSPTPRAVSAGHSWKVGQRKSSILAQSLASETEGKDLQYTSTVFNTSTNSLTRSQKRLQSPDLDTIEPPKTKGKGKHEDCDPDISAPDSRAKSSRRAKLSTSSSSVRRSNAGSIPHPIKRRESTVSGNFIDIPKVEKNKKRKEKAVTFEVEEATERLLKISKKNPQTQLPTTLRRSSAGSTPHPDRRRKPNVLYRWDSDSDSPSGWDNNGGGQVNNEQLYEEMSEPLIGSLVTASPAKKTNTTRTSLNRDKHKTRLTAISKSKVTNIMKPAVMQTVLLDKNAASKTTPAERRTVRRPTIPTKTTLSGRLFIEPLALTPAQRWAKASRVSSASRSRSASKPSPDSDPSDPPAPSTAGLSARYLRSSAPTPSPRTTHTMQKSTASNAQAVAKSRSPTTRKSANPKATPISTPTSYADVSAISKTALPKSMSKSMSNSSEFKYLSLTEKMPAVITKSPLLREDRPQMKGPARKEQTDTEGVNMGNCDRIRTDTMSGRMVRRCGVARIKVPGVVKGRTGSG